MGRKIKQVLTSLVILITFFGVVIPVRAVGYGEGKYGAGIYNIGETTSPAPTPTSSSSNTNQSSGSSNQPSSPSNPTCSSAMPSGTPDLFQINGNGTTGVKLYFSPVPSNRDRYYISYGLTPGSEEFGFEFPSDANGVIAVEVQALKANTVYYFKVRAGNGCMPGGWSNTMAARPGQKIPTYKWSALPKIVSTAVAQRVRPSSIQNIKADQGKNTPTPSEIEPSQYPEQPQQPSISPKPVLPQDQPQDTSLWQKVGNFFRGLLGR